MLNVRFGRKHLGYASSHSHILSRPKIVHEILLPIMSGFKLASRDAVCQRYKVVRSIPGEQVVGLIRVERGFRHILFPPTTNNGKVFSPMSDRSEHGVSLRQQEEPFLATFELVGFGVAHLALDGRFMMVSRRLCEIVGHPRNDLLAKSFQDIVHSEESKDCLVDRRLLAGEILTASVENRVIRKDGRTVWIKTVMAPVRDEDTRDPRYLFAVIEDITAQKEAQRALYESEGRFRLLVQLAPEAILVMDPIDHRLVEANRRAEELFGCCREELLRSGLLRFYDADQPGMALDPAAIDEHNRQALAGREVVFERAMRDAKGEQRHCEVRLAPFPCGQRKLILESYFDITERKRAEQALRESEQRFRVMADCAPVLMWMSGIDKRCTDFNLGWLEFTGRALEQELGDGWTEDIHPADLRPCLQTYVAAFDRQRPFNMEYRLRRHDGEYCWIRDTGVPRFLPDGSFAGYIGCCIDIEEQRVAEMARLEVAGRLMTAQDAERARIARELHDDIGQSLALLGIQLQRSSQPASA
jgi:PAS domain S-box-containing protein